MKKSEINLEAKKIIKDIFCCVLSSEEKNKWLDCFNFIENMIGNMEINGRGKKMFYWKQVKKIMYNNYGKKFIKAKL